MKVKEVMTQRAEFVDPATSLMEAAQIMKNFNIGALPVGENDRLIGMVTDRDISVRAVAEGRDPKTTSVRDVMSHGIIYCYEDDNVEDAANKMEDRQIRRLAVLNGKKRMVGLISLGDFVESHNNELVGEIMSRVAQPLHKNT